MKKMIILLAALLVPLTVVPSFAAQIRLFVAGISATGVQNRDEMQATLQTLLASRLNGDSIAAVGSASEADVVVTGTYVIFGKIFSLDAIAKTAAGKTVTRAFVQGESQDELIPAVGKLADKLSAELVKMSSNSQKPVPAPSMVARPNVTISGTSAVLPVSGGDFIKPREQETNTTNGWLSKRLIGAANLMAIGKTLPDGGREIFLAEAHRITFYRQGNDMTLVSEAELGSEGKIISLDTFPVNDGSLDVYVTMINAGEPSSQVWQVKNDKLVLVAEKMPFYFRSASLAGGAKKLYAQAVGREDDFYGDVAEATRNGSTVIMKNPIKMPRYGTIYNFNQFRDHDGTTFTVVIDPDGYLIVYDQEMKELWRSNDKFGGSELYFQKDDTINARVTGSIYRWVFMNQRIQISSRGEILVGKNDGFWVLGNSRSYKRGAVYCFVWNGSSLEEKWRTRETQNYMPDYSFDEARNELLILQTVQRPGITTRGASSLSIKKVE
ncbi:MAG: VCBS repeat-containing protein [Desulfuromonadaceae bacterium]|nr:VCBS repeat-containing protein [Desulfuromonadaceae bacterium]